MVGNVGLTKPLAISRVYDLFQRLVGATHMRNWLSTHYWKLQAGNKILDIGCGPGTVVDLLPADITYVGFDVSESYIKTARERADARARFIVGSARDFLEQPPDFMTDFDLVVCNGVLHHLNDAESADVLQLARKVMAARGRFVCIEPVFLVHQGWFARWVMGLDRGLHVRTEREWKRIIGEVFPRFETNIANSLLQIPYTHMIIECWRDRQLDPETMTS